MARITVASSPRIKIQALLYELIQLPTEILKMPLCITPVRATVALLSQKWILSTVKEVTDFWEKCCKAPFTHTCIDIFVLYSIELYYFATLIKTKHMFVLFGTGLFWTIFWTDNTSLKGNLYKNKVEHTHITWH